MSDSFTQISPHLWVQQSELYLTNSGIFASQGRACLIDPAIFPHEIKAMANFLAEGGLEPELIILTHSHWDHILGPEKFPGVKIAAHANYLSIVEEEGQIIQDVIENWEKGQHIQRSTPFEIPLPEMVVQDGMQSRVGDLSLEFIHVPGHAADQLAIYQSESGTLWASDILSDVEIPFVSHSLAAFEQTLNRLSTLDIRTLVPGHGHSTSSLSDIQTRFDEDIAYLALLRERITQAVQAGKSLEETASDCQDIPYRHPEDNKGPHQLNIESIYIELGGSADPKKFGWNKVWPIEDENV